MATADCKLRSHWLSCRQSFAPIGCSCAKLLFLNSENFLRTLYRKVVQIPVTSLKCVGMYGKACFKASRGLYETKLFSYAGACARTGARAARCRNESSLCELCKIHHNFCFCRIRLKLHHNVGHIIIYHVVKFQPD